MRTQVRTGQVVTALVLLFMIFDGVIHVLRIAPVVDAFRQLGYPLAAAVPLGVVELVCVALLVIPATRVIGAVLLTVRDIVLARGVRRIQSDASAAR